MKKLNYIAAGLSTIGFALILVAVIILNNGNVSTLSISNSVFALKEESNETNTEAVTNNSNIRKMSTVIQEKREVAPSKLLRIEVYDGLTMEELAAKLNRNLGNAALADKGELVASYSLSKGVDPYVATAIMIHETGRGTSRMIRTCNNVAGQKGTPSCMGSYKGYDTIDDGIRGAIDNLYRNYYAVGLNTVEKIGPKYAESNTWVSKINNYIAKIKNS
ncbi:MAG: glucosaminidase domain-containing protein [Bacilli bacterium]|nr:glucosaminidase domain-containing protein [Bacilli bacterium]